MDSTTAPRLPPLTGMKRSANNLWNTPSIPSSSPPPPPSNLSNIPNAATGTSASDLLAADFMAAVVQTPHLQPQMPVPVSAPVAVPPSTSMPIRRAGLSMDESIQFSTAAEAGARAQREVDNARGTGIFETYELGCTIVRSSKLYANQRRSNRQLPGGSDSTTAACYMLGGTSDSLLSPLVARVSPCDPREERCKAVERVLKDKTRGAICSLNGDNPREARADNLAAVRICEVVADILVAYAAKRLLNNLQQLYKSNASKDITINALRSQVEGMKRRKIDCWCSSNNNPAPSKVQYQNHAQPTTQNPAPATPENGVSTVGAMGGLGIGSSRTLAPPPPVSSVPTFNGSMNLNVNRTSAPALPAMPAGSSPLRNPDHHYAGALDAVTAAATQWPHASAGIDRK